MSEIKGPIGISCADIYLRFPEIMKEELDDLVEFLNDEHIVFEGATKKFKELQQRIDKAIEYIDELCLCSSGYFDYGDDLSPKHIVEILRGEDNDR